MTSFKLFFLILIVLYFAYSAAYVAMFTLPKVYETNKQNIDQYLDLVRSKLAEITDKVKAAIPIGKKEETAKDK